MIQLFYVNLLIALADPRHVHAEAAFRHLETSALRQGWATCPLSENGFLHIFGGKSYPGDLAVRKKRDGRCKACWCSPAINSGRMTSR